jgi:mevalonate kinase
MPAISASAPGKVILFGEHAVVYGQPAIAVPLTQISAKATITPGIGAPSGEIRIQAPDIGLHARLDHLPANQALAAAVRATRDSLGLAQTPAFTLRVNSTIPVAGGLGSGAAVSVAIIRAVSAFLGHPLPDETISALAFEVEKLHHGTPSGIDNTVVTYAKPVFFVKDQVIETFQILSPFTIVIADTGVSSPTKATVGDVRLGWQSEPEKFEAIFGAIGSIVKQARFLIEAGDLGELGPLLDQNHTLLQSLGVSSPKLDALCQAARAAGAMGAKLSGGGRGGNMVALVEAGEAQPVASALKAAGAVGTIITQVGGS